ncbi:lysophospholipid acyltransferase family protein [Dialister sp.]|uniref:lysophospholipid acyltransferase family protein n=1 Tax=Dialister sp. TaxID=1955814 RepID=UPI003F078EE1
MGYKIVRAVLNFIFFCLFRLHVEGRENVPQTGAVIVAPNHKSDWDPPLIGVAFNTRIIHYMAKEELFKNPAFGWLIRQFGTFPVKRGTVDRTAIRQAIRELKAGNPLGIFPEGTRIRKDGLGRFHSGMASLALMTGTSILPVAVIGSRDLPHRKGPLAVLIGKPVPVKKQRPDDEKIEELNRIVKEEIQQLMDDYQKKVS